MSSFTEPSSIVLIIGAICIFLFIMHGLWFSNKPQNRKLQKNDQHDQELSKSQDIAKVRIVTNNSVGQSDDAIVEVPSISKNRTKTNQGSRLNITYNEDEDYADLSQAASVSVNPQRSNIGITEVSAEDYAKQQSFAQNNQSSLNDLGQSQGASSFHTQDSNNTAQALSNNANQVRDIYDIILVADPEHPYRGEDIEEICNQYGFIQGFIKDNLKIYFVYENVQTKTDEVFRICSMVEPYYFPENMEGFTTPAIALYMSLPPKGKGFAYFKALRMATQIFLGKLGGQMQNNARQIINQEYLDAMALELQTYDLSDTRAQQQSGFVQQGQEQVNTLNQQNLNMQAQAMQAQAMQIQTIQSQQTPQNQGVTPSSFVPTMQNNQKFQ